VGLIARCTTGDESHASHDLNSLDDLARITPPGGHIIFTVRAEMHQRGGFKEKQRELQQVSAWDLVEVVCLYISVPGRDDPEGTN